MPFDLVQEKWHLILHFEHKELSMMS